MTDRTLPPGRKIELDTDTYCPHGWSEDGRKDCGHDYPPESKRAHDTYAFWTCSRCGMRRYYEVWE